MSEFTPINIKQLASRVSPLLGKLIPKFMYRHFEKLLHVEEINAFLEKHCNDETQDFLDAARELIGVEVIFEGRGIEALKEMQGQTVMFASNHPYGGPEAILLLQTLHMMFPNIKLVAQSFLRFIEPLDATCVYNKKDVRSLRAALEAKDSIQIYPAGFCSRRLKNKEVFDYEWKKGFVKMAKRNNMPIVIIYTDGALSERVHKWTKFRKIFKIKMTIETMYLVDEMFKLKGKTLRMVVGSTIDPAQLDDSVNNAEWADRLRQYCFELRHNPDAEFDPSKPATLTKV